MTMRLARLTLALAVFSTPAWATVIDFEGLPAATNPIVSPTLSVDGFDFTSNHFHLVGDTTLCMFGGCVSPVQYLAEEAGSLGQPITMTRSGGGTFTFDGFQADQNYVDSVAAAAGGFPNASVFDVLVTFGGGGSTFLHFGGDNAPSFQTFGVGLSDVVSVVFSGSSVTGGPGGIAIDNIQVEGAAVPEPGTLLLLGAGLTALGRRRLRSR